MCVPPYSFLGLILQAYKIHTCQLKSNSIYKIVCLEFLCHVVLMVLTVAFFQCFFRKCSESAWYYFRSHGRSLIEGLLESIKIWKIEFFWLNASQFTYHKVFHPPGTIIDQKLDRTPDLGQDTTKSHALMLLCRSF